MYDKLNESVFKIKGGKKMKEQIDYSSIVRTSEFKTLLQRKTVFIVPISILFLCFYLGLPILAGFTTVLTKQAFWGMSWAWIYAGAQFFMTWGLCLYYTVKAKEFDHASEEILKMIDKKY